MTWYRDPRHPEMGVFYIGERLAVPPGMIEVDPPIEQYADAVDQEIAGDVPDAVHTRRSWMRRWVARLFDVPTEMVDDPIRVSLHANADFPSPTYDAADVAADNHYRVGGWGAVDVGTGWASWSDRRPPQQLPPGELDRRLAESRCYWCGRHLDTDDPWELFCCEDHSAYWKREQADPEAFTQAMSRDDYAGGDDPPILPGDTRPTWLGGVIREPSPAPLFPTPAPGFPPPERLGMWPEHAGTRHRSVDLPTGPVHHDPDGPPLPLLRTDRMDERWDWNIATFGWDGASPASYGLEESTLRPEGIIPGPDTLAVRAVSDRLALGETWTDGPALRELDHGPYGDRTPWPEANMERLRDRDWVFAAAPGVTSQGLSIYADTHPASPVLPMRRCEHCLETSYPAIHTAEYPFPEGSAATSAEWVAERAAVLFTPFGGRAVAARIKRATQLVCTACLLPYPGPMAVPMARRWEGIMGWGLAVVTHAGSTHRVVTTEALSRTHPAVDVVGRLWGDLYREALHAATPWTCMHPGCPGEGASWWGVGAPMVWGGMDLAPVDGEPLLLTLCHTHTAYLHQGIHTNRDLHARTHLTEWSAALTHYRMVVW